MKTTIALIASRNPGTLFSEAASLHLGASAAARGATPAQFFFVNGTAAGWSGMQLLADFIEARVGQARKRKFRVHVQ